MTQEQAQKRVLLKKAVDTAMGKFKTVDSKKHSEVMKVVTELQEVQKALDDFDDSLITPEEKLAQKRYDAALIAIMPFQSELESATLELRKFKPVKTSTGDHSRKDGGYDLAQLIRKEYSEGKKIGKLATDYGVSTSAVNYYINYLQHKLKKGDVAYTPLKNKHYPFGAPYVDDNIPEDNSRYTVKTYGIKDLVKDVNDAGEKLEPIARKYSMTVSRLKELWNEHALAEKKVEELAASNGKA